MLDKDLPGFAELLSVNRRVVPWIDGRPTGMDGHDADHGDPRVEPLAELDGHVERPSCRRSAVICHEDAFHLVAPSGVGSPRSGRCGADPRIFLTVCPRHGATSPPGGPVRP